MAKPVRCHDCRRPPSLEKRFRLVMERTGPLLSVDGNGFSGSLFVIKLYVCYRELNAYDVCRLCWRFLTSRLLPVLDDVMVKCFFVNFSFFVLLFEITPC